MNPLVNIHTHYNTVNIPSDGIALYSYRLGTDDAMPPAPFTAGIHPWDAELMDTRRCLAELEAMNPAGIGEIGLDYACGADRERQEQIFRMQLAVAENRALPVVVHCVRAVDDTLRILKDYRPAGVIFHGYVGNDRQTANVINYGAYISVGPTTLRSPKTLEGLRMIVTDRLFMETDGHDTDISDIYTQAAGELATDIDHLADICYKNYIKVFKVII